MKRLLTGDKLEARARDLGVSCHGLLDPNAGILDEAELQRRILDAERARRESSLWLVALASALASVISAVAAWAAVVSG